MQDEPAIFISYGRRDAGGHGRALHEYLSRCFGSEHVFFDQNTIESGDVFPDRLRQGVKGCAVLLALIGPEWLDVRGDDDGRRLDDADDFVRREIALALEQGKKIIPVLFDDMPVPPRDRLPDPLKPLASCDALTLRGKTYEYQTHRRELVRRLAKIPGVPQPLREAEETAQADNTVSNYEVRRHNLQEFSKSEECQTLIRQLHAKQAKTRRNIRIQRIFIFPCVSIVSLKLVIDIWPDGVISSYVFGYFVVLILFPVWLIYFIFLYCFMKVRDDVYPVLILEKQATSDHKWRIATSDHKWRILLEKVDGSRKEVIATQGDFNPLPGEIWVAVEGNLLVFHKAASAGPALSAPPDR